MRDKGDKKLEDVCYKEDRVVRCFWKEVVKLERSRIRRLE